MALTTRRSASGSLVVPDIPIQTTPRKISAGLDPVTLEPMVDLPEEEKVTTVEDDGKARSYSLDYLTSKCSI